MSDRDYALFAAIVEAGSLSAAARALHLSPAMVSKRLARLEERLGASLVTRTTKRLSLTPAGERFHADISAILSAIAVAEARVSGQTSAPSGPLRISAPTSFGRMHIAPYLGTFLEEHPQVELELNLTDSFIDMMVERTDLAIRITSDIEPGLIATRLATNRRIICAAPAYLARHGTPTHITDLTGHRLLAAEGQLPWRLVNRQGTASLVEGNSHVRTNSSEVVRELAIAGVGIALRSLWDISQELVNGQLVQILEQYEGSTGVGIFAIHLNHPYIPAATTAFISYLHRLYAPIAPWENQDFRA